VRDHLSLTTFTLRHHTYRTTSKIATAVNTRAPFHSTASRFTDFQNRPKHACKGRFVSVAYKSVEDEGSTHRPLARGILDTCLARSPTNVIPHRFRAHLVPSVSRTEWDCARSVQALFWVAVTHLPCSAFRVLASKSLR
jgi:hypothetical protein